jgi:hypothetical protein
MLILAQGIATSTEDFFSADVSSKASSLVRRQRDQSKGQAELAVDSRARLNGVSTLLQKETWKPDTCSDFSKEKLSGQRSDLSVKDLFCAEAHFTTPNGEHDYKDVGGDRMSENKHNYAPSYAKHITSLLKSGGTLNNLVIAEVGILTGSGLAMWQHLFPESRIFGFDENITNYNDNLAHLKTLGMQDSVVTVTKMNQMHNNTQLLSKIGFGSKFRPAIIADDGYHVPEAGNNTFLTLQPFLADRFVYFIEDIPQETLLSGAWGSVRTSILKACPACKFSMECPVISVGGECIAVITRL